MLRYRNAKGRMLEERGYKLDGTPVKRIQPDRHVRVIRGNLSGDLDMNFVDQELPVIDVCFPNGQREVVGRWSMLCLPGESVTADVATDGQIIAALVGDESISNVTESFVRFVADDPMGGWRRGDEAIDLGNEVPGLPLRLIRLLRTNELLSLTDPYERGLIERI